MQCTKQWYLVRFADARKTSFDSRCACNVTHWARSTLTRSGPRTTSPNFYEHRGNLEKQSRSINRPCARSVTGLEAFCNCFGFFLGGHNSVCSVSCSIYIFCIDFLCSQCCLCVLYLHFMGSARLPIVYAASAAAFTYFASTSFIAFLAACVGVLDGAPILEEQNHFCLSTAACAALCCFAKINACLQHRNCL